MGAIDIGAAAIGRGTDLAIHSYTSVGKDNPANDTGEITAAEMWFFAASGVDDVWIGTFSASGDVLTCRDSESVGDVSAGSKQTFSGLAISVETGDYLGTFNKSGTPCAIERDSTGFAGIWYYIGECIDPTDSQTFTALADDAISLYGIGATPALQTISPSGIGTVEGLGGLQVNLNLAPSGLASLEGIGSPVAAGPIIASGLASLEGIGSPQANLHLAPAGLATVEGIGAPELNLKLAPSGLASVEGIGAPVIAGPITASGIPSIQGLGSPQINQHIHPPGIGSWCLSFDGENDYVDCGKHGSLDITNKITIEVWLRLTDVDASRTVIDKWGDYYEIYFPASQLHPRLYLVTGDGGKGVNFDTETTLNTWTYLAWTYDKDAGAGNIKCYTDGSPDGTDTHTGAITAVDGELIIGSRKHSSGWYKGIIDQIRISDTDRTAAEITANWNGGNGRRFAKDANTIALWYMDEGSGGTISDEVGNNDGTITGATWVKEGIIAATQVGSPQVNLWVHPSGIASVEGLGSHQLNLTVYPSGLASVEGVGSPLLTLYLLPSGIATVEGLGALQVNLWVHANGVSSVEGLGSPKLNFILHPSGVISVEGLGTPSLSFLFHPFGILGYTIEVRDGAGNLLAILENAFGITLVEQLNLPPMLDFSLPTDDSKISHISLDNEIWLRNYDTGVLVKKFLLGRRRDVRR